MANPYHSYDASFSYSQYHESNAQWPVQPQSSCVPSNGSIRSAYPPDHPPSSNYNNQRPPPARKASKRRKRHPPPGPAGAWFQSQNNSKNKQQQQQEQQNEEEDDAAPLLNRARRQAEEEAKAARSAAVAVASYPAWTAMQCDLQWMNPDISPSAAMATRYHNQRQHIEDIHHYVLLPQILHDSSLWKLPADKKLIVLVHSVSCHHDDIWTVELHDDTGASIRAWIAPGFAQSERRHPADELLMASSQQQRYIRPGYVWCIEEASLMLQEGLLPGEIAKTDEQHANNSQNRMLLIRQEHVTQVWTPHCLQKIEEGVYRAWIEKRQQLHGVMKLAALSNRRPKEEGAGGNSSNSNYQNEDATNDENGNRVGQNMDYPDEEDEEADIMDRLDISDRNRMLKFGDDDEEEDGPIEPRLKTLHPPSASSFHHHTSSRLSAARQSQQPKQQQTQPPTVRFQGQSSSTTPDQMEVVDDEDPTAMLMRALQEGPTQSSQLLERTSQASQTTATPGPAACTTTTTPAHQQPLPSHSSQVFGNLVTDPRNPQNLNRGGEAANRSNRSRRVSLSQPPRPSMSQSQPQAQSQVAHHEDNGSEKENLNDIHFTKQPPSSMSQMAAFAHHPTPQRSVQVDSQHHNNPQAAGKGQIFATSTVHSDTTTKKRRKKQKAGGGDMSEHCPAQLQQKTDQQSQPRHGSGHSQRATKKQNPTDLSHFSAITGARGEQAESDKSELIAESTGVLKKKEKKKKQRKQKKNGTELSQFSAIPALSQTQASTLTLEASNQEQSTHDGVLPQKRQKKSKATAKKKSPKLFDKSPPKPSVAKLWSSATTDFQDTTGLLDLSSSDDEEEQPSKPVKGTVSPTQAAMSQINASTSANAKTVAPQAQPENVSQVDKTAAKVDNRQVTGSLFQAFSKPGMDWIGLSDEED